jgi:Vitamin B6 photo-protection and homoeostasis
VALAAATVCVVGLVGRHGSNCRCSGNKNKIGGNATSTTIALQRQHEQEQQRQRHCCCRRRSSSHGPTFVGLLLLLSTFLAAVCRFDDAATIVPVQAFPSILRTTPPPKNNARRRRQFAAVARAVATANKNKFNDNVLIEGRLHSTENDDYARGDCRNAEMRLVESLLITNVDEFPTRIQNSSDASFTSTAGKNNETAMFGSSSRTKEDMQQAPTTTTTSTTLQHLAQVNVVYNTRSDLVYDPVQERYVEQSRGSSSSLRARNNRNHSQSMAAATTRMKFPSWLRNRMSDYVLPRLSAAFVPSGVTANYYPFMTWRILQRFVNANLHVFGTQSLLLGLGIKSGIAESRRGALSGALYWVMKDALGKIVRMLWASKMGLRFDSDARRWRMRSAYVFAAGNGLEIVTYIYPELFLLWATLANCCKQVSMLTSSSTRSSISNSFRDGTRENIGDITAKGEAQVAIIDLAGIASGVYLSKAVVGTSIRSILCVYVVLQVLEILCVYRQLRTVVFRIFNFERMIQVVNSFLDANSADGIANWSKNATATNEVSIQTPQEMAASERMFLPPLHLSRRNIAFGSLGRSKLSPDELRRLIEICRGERFLLAVGTNVKHPRFKNRWQRALLFYKRRGRDNDLQENCHIVLHSDATNADMVRSTLALALLRRKLLLQSLDPDLVRSSDCYNLIEASIREANTIFPLLNRQISKRGWESPSRYMFGRVKMRAEWPLLPR